MIESPAPAPTSPPPLAKLAGVYKTYGKQVALRGLSLEIGRGEIFGFIGPNGAGKSTTIKTLATLEYPDLGTVTVDGVDILENPEEVRSVIGYMPELFGLYKNLTVREYLEFFALAYHVGNVGKTVDQVIELTGLGEKRDTETSGLSKGARQRLYLAKILLHDPKLLLLDEPASGLDPRARIELRSLLKELRRMGKTILISSHILVELEDICTEIGIIEAGQLVVCGNIAQIKARMMQGMVVEIEVLGPEEGGRESESALRVLEADPLVADALLDGQHGVRARFQGNRSELAALQRRLVMADVPLVKFQAHQGDLEDVFLKITEGLVT